MGFEASVQRWVPESQISANSESAQFGPPRCVLGTHRRTCPGDMSLLWQPCSELCQKHRQHSSSWGWGRCRCGHVLVLWSPVRGMRLGEQAQERRQPLPEKVPERPWEGRVWIQPDFPPRGPNCPFPDNLVLGRSLWLQVTAGKSDPLSSPHCLPDWVLQKLLRLTVTNQKQWVQPGFRLP